MSRAKAIRRIVIGSRWLTSHDIDRLRGVHLGEPSHASTWKGSRRVFSVVVDGEELFPSYQFDGTGEPLPVISEIIKALDVREDSWAVAAWFHYPNAWLVGRDCTGASNLPPKAMLTNLPEIVAAARRHGGTYIA